MVPQLLMNYQGTLEALLKIPNLVSMVSHSFMIFSGNAGGAAKIIRSHPDGAELLHDTSGEGNEGLDSDKEQDSVKTLLQLSL